MQMIYIIEVRSTDRWYLLSTAGFMFSRVGAEEVLKELSSKFVGGIRIAEFTRKLP